MNARPILAPSAPVPTAELPPTRSQGGGWFTWCLLVSLLGTTIWAHGCHQGGHEVDLEPIVMPWQPLCQRQTSELPCAAPRLSELPYAAPPSQGNDHDNHRLPHQLEE